MAWEPNEPDVDTEVLAQFYGKNFYQGIVENVNDTGGKKTYDIRYYDGNRRKYLDIENLRPLKLLENDKVIMEFEMRVKSEVQEDDEKKEMKEFERRQGERSDPNYVMPSEDEKAKPDEDNEQQSPIETYAQYVKYLETERKRDIAIEERYKKHLKAWQSRNAGNSNKLDAMLDRLLSKDKEPTKHYPKWLKWHAAGTIVKLNKGDNGVSYNVQFKEHAYDIGFQPDQKETYDRRKKSRSSKNKKAQKISTFTLKDCPREKLQKIWTNYKNEVKEVNDTEVLGLINSVCTAEGSLQWVLSANNVKDIHVGDITKHLLTDKAVVEELNLYNNDISRVGAGILGQALRTTSVLVELSLSKNELDDDAVSSLCLGLSINPKLEILKLAMNSITDVGVKAIAEALKENTKLNHIELQEQTTGLLGLEAAEAMGEVFAGHVLVDLQPDDWDHIELDGNIVMEVGNVTKDKESLKKKGGRGLVEKGWRVCGIDGIRMFPRPLRQREIKKEEKPEEKAAREKEDQERVQRRLTRAQLKIEKKIKACKNDNNKSMKVVFYKYTTTNKALKYVRLNVDIIEDRELISDHTFRDMDMNQLKLVRRSLIGKTQILQKDKNGLITEMEPCKLGDVDATIIAYMMKCNTGVRQMFLNQNTITCVGAESISKALEISMVLTTLSLSDNRIGDKGVSHLIEALKNNKSLVRLDIINVDLTDHGAFCIGKGLEKNSTLKELAAGENDDITQKGFDYLVNGHKCSIVSEEKAEELDYSLFFQQRWHTITPPRHLVPFIAWLSKTKGISY